MRSTLAWELLDEDADEVLLNLLARDNEPQHHWPPPRIIPPYLERFDARRERRAERDQFLAELREAGLAARKAEQARLATLRDEQSRLAAQEAERDRLVAAQEAERDRLVAVERAEQARRDQLMADYFTRPQMARSFVRPPEPIRRAARFLGSPPLAYILRRESRA